MQVFHIIYNDYQVVKLSAAWLYILILFGSFTTSRLQMEYHYCNLVSSWGSMEYLEFQIKETIGSNVALFMKPAFQRDSSICPNSPSVVTLSNNHFIQGFYVIRDHPQIMSAQFLDLLTTLPPSHNVYA